MSDQTRSTVHYRERLNPPLWAWIAVFAVTGGIAVAVWVPLGLVSGLIALILPTSLVVYGLVVSAPTITVTDRELRINRAHIDLDYLGIVATLDAHATTTATGVNADPRAFTVMRPLSAKDSVTVEILDDDDPHPYWLISTQHPTELGRAIRDAMAAQAGSSSTG